MSQDQYNHQENQRDSVKPVGQFKKAQVTDPQNHRISREGDKSPDCLPDNESPGVFLHAEAGAEDRKKADEEKGHGRKQQIAVRRNEQQP